MSLKDKVVESTLISRFRGKRQVYPAHILKKDYVEVVALFLDARDHPEKHPELIKEFGESPHTRTHKIKMIEIFGSVQRITRLLSQDIVTSTQTYLHCMWRDFLFYALFEEERK